MTRSLGDILGDFSFDEPPEIRRIKDWVRKRYQVEVAVGLQGDQIIITAGSAALAGSLRMDSLQLQKVAQTKKRLVIRIGRQ